MLRIYTRTNWNNDSHCKHRIHYHIIGWAENWHTQALPRAKPMYDPEDRKTLVRRSSWAEKRKNFKRRRRKRILRQEMGDLRTAKDAIKTILNNKNKSVIAGLRQHVSEDIPTKIRTIPRHSHILTALNRKSNSNEYKVDVGEDHERLSDYDIAESAL